MKLKLTQVSNLLVKIGRGKWRQEGTDGWNLMTCILELGVKGGCLDLSGVENMEV